MEAQREVMAAQAKESSRQADHLEMQTEMLAAQMDERERAIADAYLDQALTGLVSTLRIRSRMCKAKPPANSGTSGRISIGEFGRSEDELPTDSLLARIGFRCVQEAQRARDSGWVIDESHEYLRQLASQLTVIEDLRSRVSMSGITRLSTIGFDRFQEAFRIIESLPGYPTD